MRKGGGKQKGAQFERDVCVMLSKWLTNNVQVDVFWRSAMSGGRSTVAAKRTGHLLVNQVGDLSCIDPAGRFFMNTFAVECKFYRDLDFKGLLTGKGKLLQFWDEIRQQAATHGKLPFLVVRQNHMQTFICVDINGRRKLGLFDRHMTLISVKHNMRLIEADAFVRVCKPYKRERRRLE